MSISRWKKDRIAIKQKKTKAGRFKRVTLFAIIFALIFNVTLGPIISNVSAASIEAHQEVGTSKIESTGASNSSGVVSSTVANSTAKQFGLFGLDEIVNTITGFFKAVFNFLDGMINIGKCVGEFVIASPSSITIAFIACPAMEQVLGIVQITEGILRNLLVVNIFYADSTGSLESTVSQFRNIANIIFAIIFLFIIAATAFGSGEGFGSFSNYGVKKMLPKLLVMAVAINTSFYICAALTDLSNVVGGGIGTLTSSMVGADKTSELFADGLAREFGITAGNTIHSYDLVKGMKTNAESDGFLGTIITDSAAMGSVVVIIGIMMAVLVIALIIQLIIVFVLMAVRNIILVTLTIVSPIAFALGILPNTNKVFQKWFNMFGHMLMVYPAVMLLFAASYLTARILAYNLSSVIDIPILLATLAAPVFFVKKVITSTSSVMGAVSSSVGKIVGSATAIASVVPGPVGVAGKVAHGLSSGGVAGGVQAGVGEYDKHSTKAGRKNFLSNINQDGSVNEAGLNKHGQKYMTAQQEAGQDKAAQDRFSNAMRGGNNQPNGGVGIPTAVHVEHGTVGNVDGLGEGGNSTSDNSLEDMRALLGRQVPTQGLTGSALAAAKANNSEVAQQAAATGLISDTDVDKLHDGTFTGTADDAIARNASTISEGRYNGLSDSSKETIREVLTSDASQAAPKESNAATNHLEKDLNVKIQVDSNVKVEGQAKVDHNSTPHTDGKGL